VHRYAQTNLQLYAQLQAADWTDPQLELVSRAYELAIDVCGGSFRPNGKPFLCHLVGTASIMASWNGPIDEVVCGLVHSVYSHGVFSDDRERGMTDHKRAIVSEAIGDACEERVADYTGLLWKADAIERYADDLEALTQGERAAIRVRLANELEDHLDLGMQFSRKEKATAPSAAGHAVLRLAEQLVGRGFSQELEAAIVADRASAAPAVLVRADTSSFRPEARST
jgi:(p)ppGpp synthase/HD superfamily hydrolase